MRELCVSIFGLFQHTAARRRLASCCVFESGDSAVSTHSRPKAAGYRLGSSKSLDIVSTHSRPKAAGPAERCDHTQHPSVSTHSRPKAAGSRWLDSSGEKMFQHTAARRRLASSVRIFSSGFSFNTQPPEGGWRCALPCRTATFGFNTQPPEGGWRTNGANPAQIGCFNTQPPEGGWSHQCTSWMGCIVSTHSRPKAAGRENRASPRFAVVSTHSRPKAAGSCIIVCLHFTNCFNTQPPEGGWSIRAKLSGFPTVSTHSRPKAAGHL